MSEKLYEYGATELLKRGTMGFERVRKENGHLRQISATTILRWYKIDAFLHLCASEERGPRGLYQLLLGFDIAR